MNDHEATHSIDILWLLTKLFRWIWNVLGPKLLKIMICIMSNIARSYKICVNLMPYTCSLYALINAYQQPDDQSIFKRHFIISVRDSSHMMIVIIISTSFEECVELCTQALQTLRITKSMPLSAYCLCMTKIISTYITSWFLII